MRLAHFVLPSLVLSASTLTLAQSNRAFDLTLSSPEASRFVETANAPHSASIENRNGNASLAANSPEKSTPGTSQAAHSIVAFPLAFEVNRGQAPSDVDFVAAGRGYRAQLQANQMALDLSTPANAATDHQKVPAHAVVRIALSGASPNVRVTGEDKLPGQTNYLFGSDPAKWITGVERYAKVRYVNVYPGIDVLFHGNQNRLEHDYIVNPGADPRRIRLGFEGSQRIELSGQGDLVLRAGDAQVRIEKPRAYQLVSDQAVEVSAQYEVRNGYASFRLGPYDAGRVLIIDPVLVYATFLGGAAMPTAECTPSTVQCGVLQQVQGMAVDASGLYVTGITDSTSFPVTSGVVGPNSQAGSPYSTFVAKLDPTGQSLIFSTYVGGFSSGATALAVDASHNVYIAGTGSAGLPIPSGSQPYQGSAKGESNLAILKLNSTGTAVLAATYLGGSKMEFLSGLAINPADNIYLAGATSSNDFPLQNPLQNALGSSGQSAFVTEFNPALSGLVYSTYLGANSQVGTPVGINQGIALDSSGNAYVVGTASAGFPVTSNAYESDCSSSSMLPCPFLATLNSAASAILYATYLGFNGDSATAVAVDASADTYVAGATASASFPVVNSIQSCSAIEGTGDSTPSGNFLVEFSSAESLSFSTCLGLNLNPANGAPGEYAFGPELALDTSGNVYFTASAQAGLPLQNPIDENSPALARPFVSEVSAATHKLTFSSFVAGPITYDGTVFGTGEAIHAITVDSSGNIYLAGGSTAGTAYSSGYSYLPVFNAMESYFFNPNANCPAEVYCTYTDGFIMEISPSAGAAAALVPGELQFPATAPGTTAMAQGTTVYDLGTDALTVSNVTASGDFAIQSNNCATVSASGGSCTIEVTFTPTALGTRNGTLTITDSSAGSPHTVVLTGLAASANLAVSPTRLTFPNQVIGTPSTEQTITLTAGPVAIQNLHVQSSGNFSETNFCGTSIAALGTCQILVAFTPTASGTQQGTITMTDSAPNSPQTVSLMGTGVTANLGLGIAAGSSSSATVAPGATAKYTLSIGGQGISGTASLTCGGAPAGAMCSLIPTVGVSANSAGTFNVTVSTTGSSMGKLDPARFAPSPWLWAMAMMGCVVLPGTKAVRRRSERFLLLFLSAFLLCALCSCGGGSGGSGGNATPAGTYTLTVTAQVGSASQSTKLTLTVQ